MIDVERFRALLLEQQQALQDIAVAGERSAAAVELDQSRVGRLSRMDALQAQAIAQEAMHRHKLALSNIAEALERIESGDYGYCMVCGDEIAVGRLEINPAGPQCVNCAQALES